MALCIEINRQTVEGGMRTLLGRRSRRAWQAVLLAIIVLIPAVYAWRGNGDGAKLTVGSASYPDYAVYSIKAFAALTVATLIAFPLVLILRSHERRMIQDVGASWETKSGGRAVVEILDNQIRHQGPGETRFMSPQEISDLLEGESYSVLVYADPAAKQSFFIAIKRTEKEFLNALKKIVPRISRSLS
jgi:hypothetical protein